MWALRPTTLIGRTPSNTSALVPKSVSVCQFCRGPPSDVSPRRGYLIRPQAMGCLDWSDLLRFTTALTRLGTILVQSISPGLAERLVDYEHRTLVANRPRRPIRTGDEFRLDLDSWEHWIVWPCEHQQRRRNCVYRRLSYHRWRCSQSRVHGSP